MIKKVILIVLAVMFIGILFNMGMYFFYPDVKKLKKENPDKTAFMKYREDERKERGKNIRFRQHWVRLSRISPYVIKAVIISEDDKFWHHEGFDYEALQQAFEEDIRERKFKVGGSTISQQLVKNLYLSPSKNPIRKIKEAILTWRIERTLSKKRIIEIYLNVAEWGEGIFGIEAAARHYFGKAASALSAREAAKLAAVLPNPRRYHPLGSSKFVRNRSERIYRIMVRRGVIIPEYEAVMKEPEEILPGESDSSEILPSPPNSEEQQNEEIEGPTSEEKMDQGVGEGDVSISAEDGEASDKTRKQAQ